MSTAEARLKNLAGNALLPDAQTIASGASIVVNDGDVTIPIVASGAVNTSTTAAILSNGIIPGRIVRLINTSTNVITLKHTAIASAAYVQGTGGTYTGSADLALGNGDMVEIIQVNAGYWVRVSSADNA